MNAAALFSYPGGRSCGTRAQVRRAPSDENPLIDVSWVVDGEEGVEVDVMWVAFSTPAEGDPVLLMQDSVGDPWALVWTGAVGEGG